MDDHLNEPLLPEVVEAKPVQEQRFMHQCPQCAGIKFEIIFISDGVKKSMLLICNKGHQTQMDSVPEVV